MFRSMPATSQTWALQRSGAAVAARSARETSRAVTHACRESARREDTVIVAQAHKRRLPYGNLRGAGSG